jgi:chromosome segregation protein
MVAIEEYQEQEDRHQFLTVQQEDLVKSKEQLLETIRTINATTTEMFNDTFQKVNANFQEMFKKLFGGGEARLELVDAGNVLESGIDIVAKPPGKKPQVISLLSGGERTLRSTRSSPVPSACWTSWTRRWTTPTSGVLSAWCRISCANRSSS